MAALKLQATANYEVHESIRVDTTDNEDHTFCGIMFPIKAKTELPVSRLLIRSVSVRGRLGAMTVWLSNGDLAVNEGRYTPASMQRLRENPDAWTKIYEKNHGPSERQYQPLDFSDNPIVLLPGQTKLIYVHSAAHHDLAIVYDHSYSMLQNRYTDSFISILSGAAHLSPEPFGGENIWGWGSAWRDNREFVGQLNVGAVYQLWSPELHTQYGSKFQHVTETLLACQRRTESPISMLPDECIYYILNMCRWDWFQDTPDQIFVHRQSVERKRQKKSKRALAPSSGSKANEDQTLLSLPCGGSAYANGESGSSTPSRRWFLSFNAIGSIRGKILNALSIGGTSA